MRHLFFSLILNLVSISLFAAGTGVYSVNNPKFTFQDNKAQLYFELDFSSFNLKTANALILTPRIYNGSDTLSFSSIGIYGRQRYWYNMRNDHTLQSSDHDLRYLEKDLPEIIAYSASTEFKPWMKDAKLLINEKEFGPLNELIRQRNRVADLSLSGKAEFEPEFIYVTPKTEQIKNREYSAQAFIEFPLSSTVINENYRNNKTELAAALSAINTIKSDPDISHQSVEIKGYASPEGPYKKNVILARERTEALRRFFAANLNIAPADIQSESIAENWEDLRTFVAASKLSHKQEILDAIDSSREADNKEWFIKVNYKEDYQILLQTCYPALRRTDYSIHYQVKTYTDIEQIKQVFKDAPHKLSLSELYRLATSYDSGSREFAEVFETAAELYPDEAAANINAANAAMSSGRLDDAENYLVHAGVSAQADFARANLAALRGDTAAAISLFTKVLYLFDQAESALEQLK